MPTRQRRGIVTAPRHVDVRILPFGLGSEKALQKTRDSEICAVLRLNIEDTDASMLVELGHKSEYVR